MNRREVMKAGIGLLTLLFGDVALAGPRRRRVRRRVRRHIRRRVRRHVAFRAVGSRRLAVVPVAVAVGWELSLASTNPGGPDVIVVVKEVKKTPTGEVLVVSQPNGTTAEVEVVREDTAENKLDLAGTELPAGDTTTPAVEADVEEEQDVTE
jgi:hypothetical protein